MKVNINSVEAVKDFCCEVAKFPYLIDAKSGSYKVDAKSIMGLFSLNLSAPVEVIVRGNKEQEQEVREAIERFVCK